MSLRDLESASIREFVQNCAAEGLLSGRVLDVGAGRQPYRNIVEGAGGMYVPWDRSENPGSCASTDVGPESWWLEGWDAVLCTQVVQYVAHVDEFASRLRTAADGGVLLMTGPTNWPHLEDADLRRYTLPGVSEVLYQAGFKHVRADYRAFVEFEGERWPIGWKVVAYAWQ